MLNRTDNISNATFADLTFFINNMSGRKFGWIPYRSTTLSSLCQPHSQSYVGRIVQDTNILSVCTNLMKMNLQQNPERSLDAFISYRRSNGSEFASLIERYLKENNLKVFIDVERLEAGKFEPAILKYIKESQNFILILTPRSLEKCIGDDLCNDWLHKEIVAALQSQCQIIPLLHPGFNWPDKKTIPKDMNAIYEYEGILWDHNYEEAAIIKLVNFIKEAPKKTRSRIRSRL